MLALKNFIQFGVVWASHVDDVKFLRSRAAQVLLINLADQISVKDPAKGRKTGRPGLTGFLYKSTVSAVPSRLLELGLITRDRAARRGNIH